MPRWTIRLVVFMWLSSVGSLFAQAQTDNPFSQAYRNRYGKLPSQPTAGDRMLANFLQSEAAGLASHWQHFGNDLKDWDEVKAVYRQRLFEMLSLDPLPEKTELQAKITGTVSHPEFTVENLHFQSRPGLYCTANVYVPKNAALPCPAILYVCGHGAVKENGISYGNKTHYQHHGAWFARNGYVCIVLDSVQLGEIEGIHHGTHRYDMWWWNSRGYTSAGAEAWNCIRALDYLQSRSDVDPSKLGVTGRSGGGAYSWWVAALDDRIKAVCPVAGITDLQNHVVDGCVEGHCDCMYMVNTYRWDYSMVAALVAPRPLLICNTDKDNIFPLDGVVRLHGRVRQFYDYYDQPDRLGIAITEGGHVDRQELQVPVMRWFNKWLKNSELPVENYAEKFFKPEQLRVFHELPKDEITTRCFDSFTVLASDDKPFSPESALTDLKAKTFGAWPKDVGLEPPKQVAVHERNGIRLVVYEVQTQSLISLRMYVLEPLKSADSVVSVLTKLQVELVDHEKFIDRINQLLPDFERILEDEKKLVELSKQENKSGWLDELKRTATTAVLIVPRCIGTTSLGGDVKYQTQIRRRFMLLGATLASSQVWDTVQCLNSLRLIPQFTKSELSLHAELSMTEIACFATLFGPKIDHLHLPSAPRTDQQAPDFLNWSRLVTPHQLQSLIERRTKLKIEP
jgi:dienelactone hydrolase